jgi:hypothetical protein
MVWDTFWSIFLQKHLVTLLTLHCRFQANFFFACCKPILRKGLPPHACHVMPLLIDPGLFAGRIFKRRETSYMEEEFEATFVRKKVCSNVRILANYFT